MAATELKILREDLVFSHTQFNVNYFKFKRAKGTPQPDIVIVYNKEANAYAFTANWILECYDPTPETVKKHGVGNLRLVIEG